MMKCDELLAQLKLLYKNQNILCFPDRDINLNYPLADEKSMLFCCYLVSLGLKKGDRIGLLMGNTPEYVLISYAAARVGFVIVPIDVYNSDNEMRRLTKEAEIKILFYDSNHPKLCCKEFLQESDSISKLQRIDLFDDFNPIESQFALESIWNTEYEQNILDTVHTMISEASMEDLFCIIYTSGSTGEDKGTLRTLKSFINITKQTLKMHRNLFNLMGKLLKYDSLALFPFYHFAGFLNITSFILGNSTMKVHLMNNFQTDKAVNMIQNKTIRIINGTPSMVLMLLDYMDKHKMTFKKPVGIIVTGAATDYEYVKKIINLKNVMALISSYGSTECGSIALRMVLGNKLGLLVKLLVLIFKKLGFINGAYKEEDFSREQGNLLGRVAGGVEVRILDEETGQYMEDGKPGEICTRTLGIEQGHYMNVTSDMKLYTEDGFMKTGDIGILRNGSLYLIGRKKHIIIRGGANISCLELESALLKCPVVKEAAVCGVPDNMYGEEIYACISTLHNEYKDIYTIHHFLEERISRFKLPKYYSLYQNLPMTGSGKCDYPNLKKNFNDIKGNYLLGKNYEIIEI